MNKVVYVGFYADINDNEENRNCYLAAVNLMNYVAKAICCRAEVTIVSPSWTKNPNGYYPGKCKNLFSDVFLQTCPTIGFNNILTKILAYFFSLAWLTAYLIKNRSHDESVVVYHSPLLFLPIFISKKIKKYRLTLQVCEIYHDVGPVGWFKKISEKLLISVADNYILSTDNLKHKFGIHTKPYCVCAGVYEAEPKMAFPEEDGKVHVVYSGIIDNIKLGAFNAVHAAKFLDNKYHVHIIGFGENDDIQSLICLINEINLSGNAFVTFDGLKSGIEFSHFLQKCHIGLSTQSPESDFNSTSFPAKIFTYIANGLSVVSVAIKVIKDSPVSSALYFYSDNKPIEIAAAVKKASCSGDQSYSSIINKLDDEFKICISKLLASS